MIIFRRRIVIAGRSRDGRSLVRAALEDDFHHFRVELGTADGKVEHIVGAAIRNPYTACPAAAAELQQLVGMALSSNSAAVTRAADAAEQCTHMFDLAGLAVAAAARGTTRREYECEVPMRVDGRTTAWLKRDGEPLLAWEVDGSELTGPDRYRGVDLRAGFARWAFTTLDEDEAEAALVLRRCTAISIGRTKALDTQIHASSTGYCFAQQPRRAQQALRIVGSTLDFTASGESLVQSDTDWLAAVG